MNRNTNAHKQTAEASPAHARSPALPDSMGNDLCRREKGYPRKHSVHRNRWYTVDDLPRNRWRSTESSSHPENRVAVHAGENVRSCPDIWERNLYAQ